MHFHPCVLLRCARALKVLDRHELTFADALALLMLDPDHCDGLER
jgi:hypothetical protein